MNKGVLICQAPLATPDSSSANVTSLVSMRSIPIARSTANATSTSQPTAPLAMGAQNGGSSRYAKMTVMRYFGGRKLLSTTT
jgi:hypothetical protein